MRNNGDNYNGKDNDGAVDAENKRRRLMLKTPKTKRMLMPEW